MNKRIGILTDGQLDSLTAKMAHGVMRYRDDVVVVIDKKFCGRSVDEINPYVRRKIPVVRDIYDAMEFRIDELLIGIAPPNGAIPEEWIDIIRTAVRNNIRIINGLHIQLSTDERFTESERKMFDDLRFRKYPKRIAEGRAIGVNSNVILTVGSDCASGKMTTALELCNGCRKRGMSADFVATGQTGMYISGKGTAIDSVISDFVSGVVEDMVVDSAARNRFVFVEGQGALFHSAYSGVSLGLLHGAAPNIVVFCHDISRTKLKYFDSGILSLEKQISVVEELASFQRECKVMGISLFAKDVSPKDVQKIIYEMETTYRIPVFAPLITGCDKMISLLEDYR